MKKNKAIRYINIFVTILIAVAFSYQIYLADKASTAGARLSEINVEIASLNLVNENLQNEYLSQTSLSRIKEVALQSGYVEAEIEYFKSLELASDSR